MPTMPPTSFVDWLVVLPVIICLAGGALLLATGSASRFQPWICASILATVLVVDGLLFTHVWNSGPLSMTMGNWPPPFGISFTADLMGAGFATLAAFVTLAVIFYFQGDAPESAQRRGLYPLVLLLLAGVSGAFLTGDLFNLYVWFEVMLIASFGLMVLAGNPLQIDAAVKYGMLNFLATTLFLAALGLLYGQLGTLNMADIIRAAAKADLGSLAPIAALFTIAFAAKAAVFPVNAWLPASYHAPPAAVSALIGSLLTKVGAYALLRLLVMLLPGPRDVLGPLVTFLGMATMVLGPLGALAETNLRRSIGFMLIGGIGVIVVAVPSGDPVTVSGGILYTAHAMLTLAGLYLVAGLIERITGNGDTRVMGGLYAARPGLSLALLALFLAISGVPPFLGFWPKLILIRGFVGEGAWVQVAGILLNALLMLVACSRLWSRICWRPGHGIAPPHAQGTGAVTIVTGTVVLLGLWPNLLIGPATIAAHDLLSPARYIAATGLAR